MDIMGPLAGMDIMGPPLAGMDIMGPPLAGTGMGPRITDVTAWLGVGGLAVAFGFWRARGGYTAPVADPFLGDSLAYTTPL